MSNKTWTHIHFNLNQEDIDNLFRMRSNLREEGVSFDTGTVIGPEGPHEWHTDWSLEGPMDVVDICAYLDVRKVKYTLVKILNHEEEE
jgi:hypothetical protein